MAGSHTRFSPLLSKLISFNIILLGFCYFWNSIFTFFSSNLCASHLPLTDICWRRWEEMCLDVLQLGHVSWEQPPGTCYEPAQVGLAKWSGSQSIIKLLSVVFGSHSEAALKGGWCTRWYVVQTNPTVFTLTCLWASEPVLWGQALWSCIQTSSCIKPSQTGGATWVLLIIHSLFLFHLYWKLLMALSEVHLKDPIWTSYFKTKGI